MSSPWPSAHRELPAGVILGQCRGHRPCLHHRKGLHAELAEVIGVDHTHDLGWQPSPPALRKPAGGGMVQRVVAASSWSSRGPHRSRAPFSMSPMGEPCATSPSHPGTPASNTVRGRRSDEGKPSPAPITRRWSPTTPWAVSACGFPAQPTPRGYYPTGASSPSRADVSERRLSSKPLANQGVHLRDPAPRLAVVPGMEYHWRPPWG